jgi:hypothetical protein
MRFIRRIWERQSDNTWKHAIWLQKEFRSKKRNEAAYVLPDSNWFWKLFKNQDCCLLCNVLIRPLAIQVWLKNVTK